MNCPFQTDAGTVRRILGVAGLAVRASLRTKTVVALLVLLAACVLILPRVVRGDGTPEGDLHILLSYTLGFSFGILCLSTLWSSCALFAAEIENMRIQLSAVKPVRTIDFWLGKWMALLAMNAVLLLAVHAGVYAQARWRIHRSGGIAAESLTSRHVTHPVLPTPRAEALNMYRKLQEQNALPKGLSKNTVLQVLEQKASERYDVLNPGEPISWTFRLARSVRIGDPVTVRVKFDTEFSTRELVKGVFKLSTAQRPGAAVEVKLDDFTQNEIEFVVDTRAFAGSGAPELRDFALTFVHAGDAKRSAALMLRARQDVVLLTPGGSFVANQLRAAAIQGGVLALLAAFGLMLSACFSLPVAAFTATVLLVLTVVGNSVVQTATEEDEKMWYNRFGIGVSRVVNQATSHAMKAEPLKALSRGERIERSVWVSSVLWNGVLIPCVFGLAGCVILRRRELAQGE